MDAKFGDTVSYRFDVAKKSSFKTLDPSGHNATNRRICQIVEPKGELREWFDAEHDRTVIDRLHSVKLSWSDCRQREIGSDINVRGRGFLAQNRPVGNTRSWPGRAKAEFKLVAVNQSSKAAQWGKF